MRHATTRVGDHVTVRGGGTPRRDNPAFFGGTIPWVTPKDMKAWDISDAQIRITEEAIANSSASLLPNNTVLLVVRSGILKHSVPIAINRRPVAINQDMKSLECDSSLFPDFLARALKASDAVILGWVRATTADNYPIDNIRKLIIPFPPLKEQQRIAQLLELAESVRKARHRCLELLDSIPTAAFATMFGDPKINHHGFKTAKLSELADFIGGSQPPKSTFAATDGPGMVRLVQIRDFKTDDYLTYIPIKLARRLFGEEDVMIGRYGPPVFQILRGLSGAYNVALMKAKPRPGISKDFLFYLLKHETLHNYVVAKSERTAGQSGVNLDLLNNYPAFVPPAEIQLKFSRLVRDIERQREVYLKQEDKLRELYSSLESEAFFNWRGNAFTALTCV